MNVARLNFSHNTHEDHKKRIDLVKKVREKLGLPIALMLDTKGPEYRIKTFKNGKITLNEGDSFTFTADEIEGDEKRVSINYKGLPHDLNKGDIILLNNGLMSFRVVSTTDTEVNAWIEAIKRINPSEVMLYSLDRVPPVSTLIKVEADELQKIADKLNALGFKTLVTK